MAASSAVPKSDRLLEADAGNAAEPPVNCRISAAPPRMSTDFKAIERIFPTFRKVGVCRWRIPPGDGPECDLSAFPRDLVLTASRSCSAATCPRSLVPGLAQKLAETVSRCMKLSTHLRWRQASGVTAVAREFPGLPRPSAMLHRPLLCVSNHAIFAGLGATPHCPPKSEFLQEFQWLDAALTRRPARG